MWLLLKVELVESILSYLQSPSATASAAKMADSLN